MMLGVVPVKRATSVAFTFWVTPAFSSTVNVTVAFPVASVVLVGELKVPLVPPV